MRPRRRRRTAGIPRQPAARVVRAVINGLNTAAGQAPEFEQAKARVANGTTVPHTLPTYVLGSDPFLSRDEVEKSFADA